MEQESLISILRNITGGFGLGGVPETLLEALSVNDAAKDLTIVSLTAGTDDLGVGQLIKAGKVRRLIAAYVGENRILERDYFDGKLQVELTPMGTIAQKLKSAGMGKCLSTMSCLVMSLRS